MTLAAHAVLVPPAAKPRFFASAEAFGKWLAGNHGKAKHVVVGYWKVGTGKASLTWAQSVEQALRYGWIDGVRHSLGADRYAIRFTPRKPGSNWSNINIGLARELIAQGRMTPAGRAAFDARDPKQPSRGSYEQKGSIVLPPDLARRLKADRAAAADFARRPPGYRRIVSWWIVSAKRADTRERRFAQLLATARAGKPLPQLDWSKRRPRRPAGKPGRPRPTRKTATAGPRRRQ